MYVRRVIAMGNLSVSKEGFRMLRVAVKVLVEQTKKATGWTQVLQPGNWTPKKSWGGALNRWKWRARQKAQQPSGAVNGIYTFTVSMNGYSSSLSSSHAARHLFLNCFDTNALFFCWGRGCAKRRLVIEVGTCHSHKYCTGGNCFCGL